MKNKIIIIGSGGHALSCFEVISKIKKFKIIGFVDKKNTSTKTLKLIGNDSDLIELRKKYKNAFIGVGQIKSSSKRNEIYFKLKKNNFYLPKIISVSSLVSKNCFIDEGTIVMNYSHVNINSTIGKACIINTGSNIEHDVQIGDFVHISTGAIINGNVKIGSNCFIGSGAIVHNGVEIGKNSIISAGKVNKKSLKPFSIIK